MLVLNIGNVPLTQPDRMKKKSCQGRRMMFTGPAMVPDEMQENAGFIDRSTSLSPFLVLHVDGDWLLEIILVSPIDSAFNIFVALERFQPVFSRT